MRFILLACAVLALSPLALADDTVATEPGPFAEPVLLTADGAPIGVESPGFASPAFADVDGDGLRDLVVGQFKQGKMHYFKNTGTAKAPAFAKGAWITSDGETAIVPDVW